MNIVVNKEDGKGQVPCLLSDHKWPQLILNTMQFICVGTTGRQQQK